ncbi:MAG: hypothetical protein GC185_13105 [Alphaproteobacteria bacterium]|nr:hypothetical protein [Alphaproteobacteria bacterium]
MTTIKAEDLDFSAATKVISSAQKFVIPVPAFQDQGEPLVYPAGAEKAGEKIADWQGKPIGDSGVVFFNGKDNSWQAAKGDGQSVIIINNVTEAQGAQIAAKINEASTDPNALTLSELKDVLTYVREDLGVVDMYNSDKGFIASKMNALETSSTGIEAYGLHKRDDRDICLAVRLSGAGEFQGPAASPQKYADGAVIVKQGDSVRLVQSDVFEETYRHASGKPLTVGEVAEAKTAPAAPEKKAGGMKPAQ